MDDGMEEFQEATCEIAAGNWAAAAKLLRAAEKKAETFPGKPVVDIRTLREQCEAQAGFGV